MPVIYNNWNRLRVLLLSTVHRSSNWSIASNLFLILSSSSVHTPSRQRKFSQASSQTCYLCLRQEELIFAYETQFSFAQNFLFYKFKLVWIPSFFSLYVCMRDRNFVIIHFIFNGSHYLSTGPETPSKFTLQEISHFVPHIFLVSKCFIVIYDVLLSIVCTKP